MSSKLKKILIFLFLSAFCFFAFGFVYFIVYGFLLNCLKTSCDSLLTVADLVKHTSISFPLFYASIVLFLNKRFSKFRAKWVLFFYTLFVLVFWFCLYEIVFYCPAVPADLDIPAVTI